MIVGHKLIRLAVLSDLHAYDSRKGDGRNAPSHFDIASERSRDTCPITALLEKIKESDDMKSDLLICPGDFSDKACRDSLKVAWQKAHEVADALGAGALVATAGNHDVDSRNLYNEYDPIEELKSLNPQFPIANDDLAQKYWAYHYHVYTQTELTLLNLNSSAYHVVGKEEIEHGRISPKTLDRIRADVRVLPESKLNVLLCHHNPHKHSELELGEYDEIKGGQLLLDLLAEVTHGEWLVIHGHKHHPKITYASGPSCSPVVFSAGSVCSTLYPRLRTETGNQFYIIEIPLQRISETGLVGTFRTWDWHLHYGWQDADAAKGLPATGGFGHRESPSRFASRIAKWLRNKKAVHATGTNLVNRFPELAYMMPMDLQKLNRNLKTRGFAIEFDRKGIVSQVVQYVTR